MNSILFVVPNLRSMFGDANAIPGHPHTGIAYLSGFLKQHGVHVDIYDERIDGPENLPPTLKRFDYDLIGITAFSYSLRNVYSNISRIKELTRIPLAVGGPHVSVSKRDILKKTQVDFAIKHEGEYTLLELLNALKNHKSDYRGIEGLIWRAPDEIIENKDRPLIHDLDSLPYPDYESFGIERYHCYTRKMLPIITQRGCPYPCNFCSVPLTMGKFFRARTPENTVAELEHWFKKGWRHFQVNDDVFNIRRERVMAICRLILERGLRITWELYNGIRANIVDEEMLVAMKDAGCVLISYGCESGNPEILKVTRKGLTLEQVRHAVELTHRVGIRCSVNFIVGHPEETYVQAMDSVRFARSLPATFVNFYNNTPYPGTSLYEWIAQNAKILFPDFLSDLSYRDGEPIYETPEFTREQRKKVLRLGYKLYERSILRYRLGRVLGTLAYWVTRIRLVHWAGRRLVSNTRLGAMIFDKLAIKFGGMVWLNPDKDHPHKTAELESRKIPSTTTS